MRTVRTAVVLLCVSCLAGVGWAQPAGASGAPSVLNHVPAEAMGFFVVSNVKALTDGVDKYLAEIGMDKMVKKEMPKGLLAAIKAQAKLGEGFNPNAGFALILLDPKPFGMNLMEMFAGRREPQGEGAPPAKKPQPPVVILVPGKDVKSVFGQYELAEAGDYTKIKIKEEVYAGKLGEYVALSPSVKALDAVVKSQKSVASELSAAEAKMIGSAAAAVRMDLAVLAPALLKMMKAQMAEAAKGERMSGPEALIMKQLAGLSGEGLKDLKGLTIGARFAKAGAVVEMLISVKPGSPSAKLLKPSRGGRSLLAKVPNLKYVLAIGSAPSDPEPLPAPKEGEADPIAAMLKMMTEGKITDAQAAKVRKTLEALGGQVRGMQLVGGGPAGAAGVFGVSLVLDCKDADKLKAAFAQAAATAEELIKQVAGDEAKGLRIAYQKGIETIGTDPVDAIAVSHPELAEMEEKDRAEMKAVLGEDKIRVLVASPDATTVVLTFGGGKAMMAKALATAKAGNGTILQAPGTAEAMKHMPKNPEAIVLVNAGNFMQLMLSAMKKMDPEEEAALPFKLTCKVPLALGVGVRGNAAHVALYVPNKLVKEVAELAVGMLSGPEEPMAPPVVPGGDDF